MTWVSPYGLQHAARADSLRRMRKGFSVEVRNKGRYVKTIGYWGTRADAEEQVSLVTPEVEGDEFVIVEEDR